METTWIKLVSCLTSIQLNLKSPEQNQRTKNLASVGMEVDWSLLFPLNIKTSCQQLQQAAPG